MAQDYLKKVQKRQAIHARKREEKEDRKFNKDNPIVKKYLRLYNAEIGFYIAMGVCVIVLGVTKMFFIFGALAAFMTGSALFMSYWRGKVRVEYHHPKKKEEEVGNG